MTKRLGVAECMQWRLRRFDHLLGMLYHGVMMSVMSGAAWRWAAVVKKISAMAF